MLFAMDGLFLTVLNWLAGTIGLTMIKEDRVWKIDNLAMPEFKKFNFPESKGDRV